jgi:hypothetical protein
VLVAATVIFGVTLAEYRRVDLGDHRLTIGHIPAIEWPDVNFVADLVPDPPQPWKPCVRGLGNRALHVELKDRLGRRCPLLGQSKVFVRASAIWRAFFTVPDEIDVSVFLVGRPVLAEVVEKFGPRLELVVLKVVEREREAVVDPGDESDVLPGLFNQPLSDLFAVPVLVGLLGRSWGQNAAGRYRPLPAVGLPAGSSPKVLREHREDRERSTNQTG